MVFKSIRESETFRDGKFAQVLLVSFSFMFAFTAFQTTGIIEETVLQSLRNETRTCQKPGMDFALEYNRTTESCPAGFTAVSTFTGNGYTSLSIIYGVFAVASWIAPSVVAILYPKWSMVISSVVYVAFILSFLFPMTWLLYVLSALLGAAAALLWTAQGSFLSIVSTPETISRNSGIFWAINQCSMFFGNLLVFWQLQGKTVIDAQSRTNIFIPLTLVGVVGITFFCLLKNLRVLPEDSDEKKKIQPDSIVIQKSDLNEDPKSKSKKINEESAFDAALGALKDSLKLFVTGHMLLLSLSSIYSGLEFSFLSGVYSTAVGNTQLLGADAKKYVGLVGILTGVGEVIGGSLFGLLGSRTTKRGRTPIVLLGAAVHILSFAAIYFNLPDAATLRETMDTSFFETPFASVALICALLLGFGDACLQTQLIATFASVYKDKSAAAFAIFKFTQSAASATAFFSSSYMGIFVQMTLLLVTCIISSAAFFLVEWRTGRLNLKNAASDASSPAPTSSDRESSVETETSATSMNL